MAIPEYRPRAEYIGGGNLATYTFDFQITDPDHMIIQVIDAGFNPIFRIRGADGVNVLAINFVPTIPGGTITLAADLPFGYNLTILLAPDEPVQLAEFKNKSSFTLAKLEAALDAQAAVNQRLMYLISRAIKLSDNLSDTEPFNTTIPFNTIDHTVQDLRNKTLIIGPDNASVVPGPSQEDTLKAFKDSIFDIVTEILADAGGAGGVPEGGEEFAMIEKTSDVDGEVQWTDPFVFQGVSARFSNQLVDLQGLKATVDWILDIQYKAPTISLSSPQNTLREKGTIIAGITLNALLGKFSNPIAEVEFFQGAIQIGTTQNSGGGIPSGGTSTQVYAPSFSDNISFSARTRDVSGGTLGGWQVSNTLTFPFVYPYFYGAGSAGLGAGVAALTKEIITNTSNYSRTIVSAGGQKLYMAYPASYGALTSILDANLFEVISTFTASTVNITGLDGVAVSYRVYESNNLVIAGSFAYQFKK